MEGDIMNTTNPRRNAEGYPDPTSYAILMAIEREEYRKLHPRKPIVYICSPFAGDIVRNTENARQYCKFAVRQGTIPFAPHLFYPQFMSDDDPEQRKLGLLFGMIWLCKCDELWCFGNRISDGMRRELAKSRAKGIPIKFYTQDCEVVNL
jgi:hypothetical protein